jgi:hypothetical protein
MPVTDSLAFHLTPAGTETAPVPVARHDRISAIQAPGPAPAQPGPSSTSEVKLSNRHSVVFLGGTQ